MNHDCCDNCSLASPNNSVRPNIRSLELAEALNRVLPFTASDDARPILQCVNFVAKECNLTLVSADILKACGGMVDFSLANALSPMLFSLDG